MIIKWYNRDEFSDQDMIRAKAAADRLLGKRGITQADCDDLTKIVMLKSRQLLLDDAVRARLVKV